MPLLNLDDEDFDDPRSKAKMSGYPPIPPELRRGREEEKDEEDNIEEDSIYRPTPTPPPIRKNVQSASNNRIPVPDLFSKPEESKIKNDEEFEEDSDDSEIISGTRHLGLTVGAIVLIVLFLILGFRIWSNSRQAKQRAVDEYVKTNITGGVYVDGSSEDVISTSANVITEIMTYEKIIYEDGRYGLILGNTENDLTYSIFIPYNKYTSLSKQKGFILIDKEIIENKITFLFISSKQDKFDELVE